MNYIRPWETIVTKSGRHRRTIDEHFFDSRDVAQLQAAFDRYGKSAAVWKRPDPRGPWDAWDLIGGEP